MTTVEEILRFADFELDRGAYELRRNGRGVPLERIPLDLLFLLIERPGRLVTRQEIIERVWSKGVCIDAEGAINTAIRKLRRALKDDPDTPRFVATIPTKGYRFVGVVARAHHESKVSVQPAVLVGRHAERLDDTRRLLGQLTETLETDDDDN